MKRHLTIADLSLPEIRAEDMEVVFFPPKSSDSAVVLKSRTSEEGEGSLHWSPIPPLETITVKARITSVSEGEPDVPEMDA